MKTWHKVALGIFALGLVGNALDTPPTAAEKLASMQSHCGPWKTHAAEYTVISMDPLEDPSTRRAALKKVRDFYLPQLEQYCRK